MTLFANRTSAGQALATRLPEYANRDVLVLGLPRGGVPVAYEVAKALNAELDVMIVRKVGAPFQPELALGAVASGGVVVLNEDLIAFGENEAAVRQHAQEKLREVATRERRFRGDRPPPEIANRTVILVDVREARPRRRRSGVSGDAGDLPRSGRLVCRFLADRRCGSDRAAGESSTSHRMTRDEREKTVCGE
jgi:putative phosphoribosyl transferase